MHGLLFQGAKCVNIPKGNWSTRKGKAMYLAWDMSNKGAPDYARSMSETRSRSWWSRTRARWSSGRRRRRSELAGMTGSLTVVRRRRRRVGLRFMARDLDQLKAVCTSISR